MNPLLGDERRQRINVARGECTSHVLGGLPHSLERVHHARLARGVCAENRVDRLTRNSALACIDDETSSLDLITKLGVERNARDIGHSRGEAQTECAAERRRVMVLPAAGDPEVANLDRSAELGDFGERHYFSSSARECSNACDAGGRGAAEPRADGEVTFEMNLDVFDAEALRGGGAYRTIGGAIAGHVSRIPVRRTA